MLRSEDITPSSQLLIARCFVLNGLAGRDMSSCLLPSLVIDWSLMDGPLGRIDLLGTMISSIDC